MKVKELVERLLTMDQEFDVLTSTNIFGQYNKLESVLPMMWDRKVVLEGSLWTKEDKAKEAF